MEFCFQPTQHQRLNYQHCGLVSSTLWLKMQPKRFGWRTALYHSVLSFECKSLHRKSITVRIMSTRCITQPERNEITSSDFTQNVPGPTGCQPSIGRNVNGEGVHSMIVQSPKLPKTRCWHECLPRLKGQWRRMLSKKKGRGDKSYSKSKKMI